jgi:hypothetical protein
MDWTRLGPLCQLVPIVHINDAELCLRDVYIDGRWDFHNLGTMLSPEVRDYIHQIHAPVRLDMRLPDEWTWKHTKQGVYYCSSGYHWLLQQNRTWDVNCNMN